MAYNYINYDGKNFTDLKKKIKNNDGSETISDYYRVYLGSKLMYERQNNLHLTISGGKVTEASFDYITTDDGRQDFLVYTLTARALDAESWSNGAWTGVKVDTYISHINTKMNNSQLKAALQPLSFSGNGMIVVGEKSSTAPFSYSTICDVDLIQWKKDGNAFIWECFESDVENMVLQDFIYPLDIYLNIKYTAGYMGVWTYRFKSNVITNGRSIYSHDEYGEGNQDRFKYPRLSGQIEIAEKGIIRDAKATESNQNIILNLSRSRRCKVIFGVGQRSYASGSAKRSQFSVNVL